MNDYAYSEPDYPPIDYENEPYFPPVDYADEAFYLPDDPYQTMYLEAMGDDPYPPPPMMDEWIPDDTTPVFDIDDYPGPEQDGLQSQDQQFVDDVWRWQDTRLIGVERDQSDRYEIGAIDVYAHSETGEVAGQYLPLIQVADHDTAIEQYNTLDEQLAQQSLDAQREFLEAQTDTPQWQSAGAAEFDAYHYVTTLQNDDPPRDAIDPLLEQAFELGGVEIPTLEAPQSPTHSALDEIGLRLAYADLEPPMFTDEATNTHFWIGVFQPDTSDTENCITSILSLTPDENGGYQAQLAPCVVGDLDTAHNNANFLIEKAQQGGMDYAFDAAEAMARGSQQHDIWQNERGIPMELEL